MVALWFQPHSWPSEPELLEPRRAGRGTQGGSTCVTSFCKPSAGWVPCDSLTLRLPSTLRRRFLSSPYFLASALKAPQDCEVHPACFMELVRAERQQQPSPALYVPTVFSARLFRVLCRNRPLTPGTAPRSLESSSDSPWSILLQVSGDDITSPYCVLSGQSTPKSFSYFSGDLASSPLTKLPHRFVPLLIHCGPSV